MREQELEQKIRTAMDHAAPDPLERILAACGPQANIVPMPMPKKHRRWAPLAVAAMLALVCTGVFGLRGWQTANAVDSIVMLDVNPSLSILVNARERVLEVVPLNTDAQNILGDMELEGTQLDVAVNALIGSMLQKGYLSDLQNSILVSVENQNADRSAALQQRLTDAISAVFQGGSLEGAVLAQTVSEDETLAALAQEYHISLGKAALIQEVVEQDETLTFASLAPLSVNEIALITESRQLESQSVTQTGAVSSKAYISEDAACAAAFRHAGLSAASAFDLEVELDSEDGIMVYEVEFKTDSAEYEYDINARTGDVVKFSRETRGKPSSQPVSPTSYIGESSAKGAALAHAGLSESGTKYCNAWLEYDDGRPDHYAVEFQAGTVQYKYEIGLTDGAVLKYHTEHSGKGSSSETPAAQPAADIGSDAACAAAFRHAGVSSSGVYDLEIELDHDDGVYLYEIEFKTSEMEYEYKIQASDGSILKSKYEALEEPEHGRGDTAPSSEEFIGEAAALQIALEHAGVRKGDAEKQKCKLDEDDGIYLYEVKFETGDIEYEYEIDARTGAILDADMDD